VPYALWACLAARLLRLGLGLSVALGRILVVCPSCLGVSSSLESRPSIEEAREGVALNSERLVSSTEAAMVDVNDNDKGWDVDSCNG
jgi:hypothetical protein